jgi:hypothetical protein
LHERTAVAVWRRRCSHACPRRAGADVAAADNNGCTPLHWLAAHADEVHVKIAGGCLAGPALAAATTFVGPLSSQPGSLQRPARRTSDPRHQLLHHRTVMAFQTTPSTRPTGPADDLITKHKAPVAPKDGKGCTPLHAAAAAGNSPMAQLLLRHKADVSDAGPGHTPLHAAAKRASVPVVDLLLGAGAAPDQLVSAEPQAFPSLAHLPSSDMPLRASPSPHLKLHAACRRTARPSRPSCACCKARPAAPAGTTQQRRTSNGRQLPCSCWGAPTWTGQWVGGPARLAGTVTGGQAGGLATRVGDAAGNSSLQGAGAAV